MNQHAYTRCVRLAAKAMTRVHVAAYRATRGRIGTTWLGGEVVFLATTGRRSGRRRIAPLVCIRDDSALAVVASNGGSDRTPDWWLNLQHQPLAEIELGGTKRLVRARLADDDEQESLADSFVRAYPRFERYRQRARRAIPVVVLAAM